MVREVVVVLHRVEGRRFAVHAEVVNGDRVGKDGLHRYIRGVSTDLGYLGNGSGAVMPIEALVSDLSCQHRTHQS